MSIVTFHQVGGVVGRTHSHTQQFAAQFNIPKVYQSYKEMASDPEIGKFRNPM